MHFSGWSSALGNYGRLLSKVLRVAKMGGIMKPAFISLIAAMVVLSSCQPDKPWSPDDEPGIDPGNTSEVKPASPVKEPTNIGDVEQGLWFEARLVPDSIPPGATNEEVENRRDRLAIVNVTLPRPLPDQLMAVYTLESTRSFENTPVVLRAQILVDGVPVGNVHEVIEIRSRDNKITRTVDLLSAFEQVPDSFLATVEGEFHLMPEGTDASTLDPATATSGSTSKAIQFNPIRVNVVPGNDAPGAIIDDSAPSAMPETAEPEETSPTDTLPAEAPVEAGAPEPAPAS